MSSMSSDAIGKNLCQACDVAVKIVFFHHSPACRDPQTMAQGGVID